MEKQLFHDVIELEEILKTKPKTPKCFEDRACGKCLIWTKDKGWRIEK